MGRKPHKYGAVRTTVDGYSFASKAEAKRYSELKLLLLGEAISELVLQPQFPILVNNIKICSYVADFSYYDNHTGKSVVEDVKGMETPVFKLKKKLFNALYPELELRLIKN